MYCQTCGGQLVQSFSPPIVRAFDEHFEPVSSITEHTTRAFEHSYNKGERR